MNLVVLAGNLGADPELRVTPGGQAILKLRVATTESYLDKNNARQERTEWHQVTVWGKRGEALSKILEKGASIVVQGSLRTTSYEKDGEKRYRTEVNAADIQLMGKRQSRDENAAPQASASRYGKSGAGANAKHTAPSEPEFEDDDTLPF